VGFRVIYSTNVHLGSEKLKIMTMACMLNNDVRDKGEIVGFGLIRGRKM